MQTLPTVKTKGELEAGISQTIIRLKRDLTGRGPLEVRSYLIEDMVVVRLRGVLTPAEHSLLAVGATGRQLVRQMRQELVMSARPVLEESLSELLGVGLRNLHADFDFTEDACVLVICLKEKPRLLKRTVQKSVDTQPVCV